MCALQMSATNARALNTMRQRVKKHNAGFQKEIEAFREHPVSSSEDEPEGAQVLSTMPVLSISTHIKLC
jgi:Eukaryotic translation initiation factor 3 subunit 8 N-terminus